MPRIRQYEDKYRRGDFEKAVKAAQVLAGMDDRMLAATVGMSHTTLWRRIKNPDEFRVGELMKVVDALELDIDDVLGLVGMKRGLKVLEGRQRIVK